MQPKSQSKEPESCEGPKLHPVTTKLSKALKLKIVELEHEEHVETSESSCQSKILVLARYVKRHHAPEQIIGDKSDGTITRNKSKGTSFLTELKPRSIKDALDNKRWIEEMNEEI